MRSMHVQSPKRKKKELSGLLIVSHVPGSPLTFISRLALSRLVRIKGSEGSEMPPRRAHTKSRQGCDQCKRRRVKVSIKP